jgi:hypothetical protein
LNWNVIYNRIKYNGYIINLVIKAFLFQELIKDKDKDKEKEFEDLFEEKIYKIEIFRNIDFLGKFHNIVIYIRGSASRIAQFKNLTERNIPFNNNIKWNS